MEHLNREIILQSFEVLKYLEDNRKRLSLEEISNMLKDILITAPIMSFQPGYFFLRARYHEKPNTSFDYEHLISYRTDYENIEIGRANYPKQSVFYCGDDIGAVIFEVDKFSDNVLDKDDHRFTIGKWIITNPFSVYALFNLDILKMNNSVSNKWREFYISNYLNYSSEVWLLNSLIGEIFSKKDDDDYYKISSSIFDRLMTFRNANNTIGIVYPSLEFFSNFMNFAILPEHLSDHLMLNSAIIYESKFIKVRERELKPLTKRKVVNKVLIDDYSYNLNSRASLE